MDKILGKMKMTTRLLLIAVPLMLVFGTFSVAQERYYSEDAWSSRGMGDTHWTQGYWSYGNYSLRGNYASQLTGTINCPEWHPFAQFNGPFALTGRVSADGKGNIWGTVYENYNGMLIGYSWEGTYDMNQDGTFLLDAYYELPELGDIYVQMFGVLCDRGKQVRLMHVGPTYAPNMVGTTIIGSWIRQ